jgi:hypothetical protein
MSGIWFGGLTGHGYPQQGIFLLDAGYGGHKKKLADKLIHVL